MLMTFLWILAAIIFLACINEIISCNSCNCCEYGWNNEDKPN